MKKLVSLAVLFGCLVMVGCVEKQSTSVATVNGVEISSQDFNNTVNRSIALIQSQNPQAMQQPNMQDIIGKRVLQDMIIKEVFLQQAKKSKIEATKEEINSVVSRVKGQFKVNADGKELSQSEQEKAFEDALKAQNLTKAKYLENIANDIIIDKYRRALISSNLKPVSKEDSKTFFNNVSAIYNNDKNKIEELRKVPGRYEEAAVVAARLKATLAAKTRFDLILVYADKTMSSNELKQRQQLANSIRKEIKDKSNFADIAQKYSQQKDARVYFSQMIMVEGMQPIELSSKAFQLNVGDVSNVFNVFRDNAKENSAQGYFIMNVVEKVAGQKFTYESFEKDINAYINTKRAESLMQQATATLLKEANIKVSKTFEMDKANQNSKTATATPKK
jgi:hypothetical protein